MSKDYKVLYCPHCGNRAPQKPIFDCFATIASSVEEYDPFASEYCLAQCLTCEEISLYNTDGAHIDAASLLWPHPKNISKSVPEKVAAFYREALSVRHQSPSSFAVQIRRALEALCADRGSVGANLADRLKDLASKNEIPPVLSEMGEVLRILGNLGAHATTDSVPAGHVAVLDDFFRAICEYVYVAPARVAAVNSILGKLKKP